MSADLGMQYIAVQSIAVYFIHHTCTRGHQFAVFFCESYDSLWLFGFLILPHALSDVHGIKFWSIKCD